MHRIFCKHVLIEKRFVYFVLRLFHIIVRIIHLINSPYFKIYFRITFMCVKYFRFQTAVCHEVVFHFKFWILENKHMYSLFLVHPITWCSVWAIYMVLVFGVRPSCVCLSVVHNCSLTLVATIFAQSSWNWHRGCILVEARSGANQGHLG